MVDAVDALRSSLADRYRIEREIGAGGMATVYLALDLRHGRAVAIKVLRPDLAAAIGVERFQREVALTASLQHPHILSLVDSGESSGCVYYVTPYVEGESLREKLAREGQLRIEEALEITRQVADALDYAHHHGIIHRDIKPENILLAPYARDGRTHALVADFGIARALPNAGGSPAGFPTAGDNHITQTGLALGTPAYMSPEQTMGDTRIDARSDVYSLACVVYEMLAGEPPFTGPTGEVLTARKLAASIPSIAQIRSSVPPSVDAVISRGLVPVAADRYATAGEFATALAGAFATGAGVPRRVLRPRVIALSGAALAMISVGAWAFASHRARTVGRGQITETVQRSPRSHRGAPPRSTRQQRCRISRLTNRASPRAAQRARGSYTSKARQPRSRR
jgi:eukaryotic-like serine/threonine-protein kinase